MARAKAAAGESKSGVFTRLFESRKDLLKVPAQNKAGFLESLRESVGVELNSFRSGYGKNANIYLEADYSVPIYLPRFTFSMYFNPSSAHKRPTSSVASDSSSR